MSDCHSVATSRDRKTTRSSNSSFFIVESRKKTAAAAAAAAGFLLFFFLALSNLGEWMLLTSPYRLFLPNESSSTHGAVPNSNQTNAPLPKGFINFVLLSERKTDLPFKGFVNSVLKYTTSPVAMHIIRSEPYPFLEELSGLSPNFAVYYYRNDHLHQRSSAMLANATYYANHHASVVGPQKFFLGELSYHQAPSSDPHETVQTVLLYDDDMTLFEDARPLWDEIIQHPHKVSVYCPVDPIRVEEYFLKPGRPDNGEIKEQRYCIPVLMGIPVEKKQKKIEQQQQATMTLGDKFTLAFRSMDTQYPMMRSYVAADQDGLNRFFKDFRNETHVIPCHWHCDVHSCNQPNGTCQNCGNMSQQPCKAYHWLNSAFTTQPNSFQQFNESWSYTHYYSQNTKDLLLNVFDPNVRRNQNL